MFQSTSEETITFKNSIWDASVIVMLHLCDTARKVVGNFNVSLAKGTECAWFF